MICTSDWYAHKNCDSKYSSEGYYEPPVYGAFSRGARDFGSWLPSFGLYDGANISWFQPLALLDLDLYVFNEDWYLYFLINSDVDRATGYTGENLHARVITNFLIMLLMIHLILLAPIRHFIRSFFYNLVTLVAKMFGGRQNDATMVYFSPSKTFWLAWSLSFVAAIVGTTISLYFDHDYTPTKYFLYPPMLNDAFNTVIITYSASILAIFVGYLVDSMYLIFRKNPLHTYSDDVLSVIVIVVVLHVAFSKPLITAITAVFMGLMFSVLRKLLWSAQEDEF